MTTLPTDGPEAIPIGIDWVALALSGSPDVLVVLGDDFRVRWVSPSVERLYGFRPDDLIGRTPDTLVHPEDLGYAIGALLELHRRGGEHLPVQLRFLDARGDQRLVEVAAFTDDYMVLSLRDITRREVLPARRRELEQLVQHLSNQAASVSRGGLERVVIGGLADLGRFLGADAMIFSSVDVDRCEVRLEHEWVRPDSRSARTYRPITSTTELLWDATAPPQHGYLFVPDLAHVPAPNATPLVAAGLRALLDVPVVDHDRVVAVVSARWTGDGYGWDDATASLVCIAAEILNSVVHRLGGERRLEYQATRDGLTGMPNRVKLAEILDYVMADADPAAPPSLLFCDLEGFTEVNDRCGRHFGDRVLAGVARRIEEVVRDVGFVARVGGDEFVVVVPPEAASGRHELSEAIRLAVLSLEVIEGINIHLDVSVGRAFWEQGDTAEEWLRRADRAMYEQKGNHRI